MQGALLTSLEIERNLAIKLAKIAIQKFGIKIQGLNDVCVTTERLVITFVKF